VSSVRSLRMAFALLLLAGAFSAVQALAQKVDLNRYLVGKWHQDVGKMTAETVFNSNHTFTSLAWTRGTPYRNGSRGDWEIRNDNQLWMHNRECSPDACAIEWDDTKVEVIDDNHFRNRFGEVYRLK
jgi:hypothetical protein